MTQDIALRFDLRQGDQSVQVAATQHIQPLVIQKNLAMVLLVQFAIDSLQIFDA
jgi:hypothetical protein